MPFGRRPPEHDLASKLATPEERKPVPRPSPAGRRLSSGPPPKALLAKVVPLGRKRESESTSSEEPDKVVVTVEPRPPKDPAKRPDTKSIAKECSMCHVTETSTWRRDDTGKLICNKCGLRRRKDNRPKRPRKSQVPICEATNPVAQPDIASKQSQGLSIFSGDDKIPDGPLQSSSLDTTTADVPQIADNRAFATCTESALTSPVSLKPAGIARKTGPRRSINPITMEPKSCLVCRTEQSPAWRKDADGNALCNRCMLRQKRAIESANRKYTPRAKPISPRQGTPLGTIPSSYNASDPPKSYDQSRMVYSSPAHMELQPVPCPIPIDPQLMGAEGNSIRQVPAANMSFFKREESHPKGMNFGPTTTTAYYPPVIPEAGFYGSVGDDTSTRRTGAYNTAQPQSYPHQQPPQRSQQCQQKPQQAEIPQHQQQQYQQQHQPQQHQLQQNQNQQHQQNSYGSASAAYNQQQDTHYHPNISRQDGDRDTGPREPPAMTKSSPHPVKHYNYHPVSTLAAFQPRLTQPDRNPASTTQTITSDNSDNILPSISSHSRPLSTHETQNSTTAPSVCAIPVKSSSTATIHSTLTPTSISRPTSTSRPTPTLTSILAPSRELAPNPHPNPNSAQDSPAQVASSASHMSVKSSTPVSTPSALLPPPPPLSSSSSSLAPSAGHYALLNEPKHRPWTPHPNPKFSASQKSD